MSREIKFRGKHSDKWIYGYLLKNIDDDKYYISVSLDRFYQVKKETIGQYVGLNDKNGVEIYEEDIVLLDCYNYEEPAFDGKFKVVYDEINGMWLFIDLEDEKRVYTFEDIRGCYKSDIEVIGNIYENEVD